MQSGGLPRVGAGARFVLAEAAQGPRDAHAADARRDVLPRFDVARRARSRAESVDGLRVVQTYYISGSRREDVTKSSSRRVSAFA